MKKVRELLLGYEAQMLAGDIIQANETLKNIYTGLIDDGYMVEELSFVPNVQDIFNVDYEVTFSNTFIMTSLCLRLVEMAISDMLTVDEGEEIGEDISNQSFVVVKHELDLEEGTDNRLLLPYVFSSLGDVEDYLNFKLEVEALEVQITNTPYQMGYTDILSREDLKEVLVKNGTYYDVIAENIPETCVGASVIAKRSTRHGALVKADLYALYEVTEFPSLT